LAGSGKVQRTEKFVEIGLHEESEVQRTGILGCARRLWVGNMGLGKFPGGKSGLKGQLIPARGK
jgi:hypothetical protein